MVGPNIAENELAKMAGAVVRLGLAAPAAIFLEMHRPLTSLVYNGTLLFEPLAAPLFGAERFDKLQRLFANSQNVDRLIELIRDYSTRQSRSKEGG